MCVPPRFTCGNLTTRVTVFEVQTSGGNKVMKREPQWWDQCLYKGDPRAPLPLLPCEDTTRRCHLWTRKQTLTRHPICQSLILDIQPQFVGNQNVCCLSNPVSSILWQQPKRTRTEVKVDPLIPVSATDFPNSDMATVSAWDPQQACNTDHKYRESDVHWSLLEQLSSTA